MLSCRESFLDTAMRARLLSVVFCRRAQGEEHVVIHSPDQVVAEVHYIFHLNFSL